MKIPTLAYLFFSGLVVSCLSANVYVDDADPAWAFSGVWNVITPSNPCPGCVIQPDPFEAFDGTWHDTSNDVASAQLSFTGVSIQIYTICPPVTGSWTFFTNVSFTLDGVGDGLFVGPVPCSQYVYNYAVYTRMDLTYGFHVVNITTNPVFPNDQTGQALLLDYAIYNDGTSNHTVPTWAVVTSVIAALLLVANLAQLVWYRRSKRLQGHVGGDGMSPPTP
jgi:hypothetical protein